MPGKIETLICVRSRQGGRRPGLEANGPPPLPSWLVCGFCLRERRNNKDKSQSPCWGTTLPSIWKQHSVFEKSAHNNLCPYKSRKQNSVSLQKWKQKSVLPKNWKRKAMSGKIETTICVSSKAETKNHVWVKWTKLQLPLPLLSSPSLWLPLLSLPLPLP